MSDSATVTLLVKQNKQDKRDKMEKMLLREPTLAEAAKSAEESYQLDKIVIYKIKSVSKTALIARLDKQEKLSKIDFRCAIFEHPDGYDWYRASDDQRYHFCVPRKVAKSITDHQQFMADCQLAINNFYSAFLRIRLQQVGLM